MADAPPRRFAEKADLIAERQDAHAAALAEAVRRFVRPRGDERALDAGTGAGALALALAPLVREVVGVDVVPELLERARARATGLTSVEFVEADATRLPFPSASFDLAGTLRTLHHVARPDLVVAELARVTRPGGAVLVVDQIAPDDPGDAAALDRFEQARDPSHTRLLSDDELRRLLAANGLVLRRHEVAREQRDLAPYLDLAGCEGEARERALALAPEGRERYSTAVTWYLLDKPR